MLNDLLNALKEAIKNNDKKKVQKIKNQLNKIGIDNYTIYELLKD